MTDSILQENGASACPYATRKPSDIDPRAHDFMDDPFEFYRLIRKDAPVYREESSGIYFVGSYELIARVLRDPTVFSSAIDRPSMRVGGVPERVRRIRARGWSPPHTMTRNDDVATHDAFRSLVSAHFMPKSILVLEPFVRERTDDLLAAIKAADECDFVTAFSVPLPISVIARYLGFDECGDAAVKRWSDALVDNIGLLTSEERAIEVAEQELECHGHILELCARRRVEPKDDLITVLARAHLPCGRPLTDPELISMVSQMMVAGNETTTNSLSAGMRRLATDPALVARLKAEPKLVTQFVEETRRLESPVQGQFRRAVTDVELDGITIPAGSLLHLRLASANRDEAIFGAESESMQIGGRPPKAHLAFGAGMHFCLGATLSRLEMRTAFARILRMFDRIELAGPQDELRHHTHFHLRGLKALPLRMR